MLSVLIPKLILKGAIKNFIVKPFLTASASIIPSKVVCDASLLGYHSQVLMSDLYKFGADHMIDKILDKKLDFMIRKLTKHQFEIEANNEWAKLFMKLNECASMDKIIIDMRNFDHEIEVLTQMALLQLDDIETGLDSEHDQMMNSFEDDLDEIDTIIAHQINQLNNLTIADRIILDIPDLSDKKKSIIQI